MRGLSQTKLRRGDWPVKAGEKSSIRMARRRPDLQDLGVTAAELILIQEQHQHESSPKRVSSVPLFLLWTKASSVPIPQLVSPAHVLSPNKAQLKIDGLTLKKFECLTNCNEGSSRNNPAIKKHG